MIVTKVVFTWDGAGSGDELAPARAAVHVQSVSVGHCPEPRRPLYCQVAPNVDQLHFLALPRANVVQYVEVLEAAPHVVGVVDALGREAAGRPPVRGVPLQGLHAGQRLSRVKPLTLAGSLQSLLFSEIGHYRKITGDIRG